MKIFISAFFLLFSSLALSQQGWKDEHGLLTPDTDFRKSKNGFGGWLLVTSDADWRTKWETPSETIPHFTEAKSITKGNQVFVLTFFSNPLLVDGNANVSCDIDVIRPNGTSSIHQVGAVCFKGTLAEDAHHLFLSAPIIGFTGDPGDPVGEWLVRVKLRDNLRHIVLPLKTSFLLK